MTENYDPTANDLQEESHSDKIRRAISECEKKSPGMDIGLVVMAPEEGISCADHAVMAAHLGKRNKALVVVANLSVSSLSCNPEIFSRPTEPIIISARPNVEELDGTLIDIDKPPFYKTIKKKSWKPYMKNKKKKK